MTQKLWPNSTIVCIGSGPSLTPADVDAVRGRARVIVINTSVRLAPWADVLYAADQRWWEWHHGAMDFQGLKFSIHPSPSSERWNQTLADSWRVTVLKNTGTNGLELNPACLKTGMNSGYQAIGLAVHLGARRIVLLGYDMQKGPKRNKRWHPDHQVNSGDPYHQWVRHFESMTEPLKALGIEVLNATRSTALTTFPRVSLEDVNFDRAEVAA